jgi:hypothetical protein
MDAIMRYGLIQQRLGALRCGQSYEAAMQQSTRTIPPKSANQHSRLQFWQFLAIFGDLGNLSKNVETP